MSFARLALVALFALASVASAAPEAAAPARPRKQYPIEQFMATTTLGGASFSPDESKILFSSNVTGIFNVYTVSVNGGEPTALTASTTDTTQAVAFFPGDERVLFTRDQGGNELNHLYVRDPGGRERDLTPGEKLKAVFQGWNRAGTAFHVLSNERDPRYFDLYRYDAKTYDRTLVYKDEVGYFFGDISDDGRWIAFGKVETTSDSDVYLYDTRSKEMKNLTAHSGQVSNSVASFDPEGQALYYLTNEGGEFAHVKRYLLAIGRYEEVEKAEWDVSYTTFSHAGRYRVTAVNEDGRTVIRLHDRKTEKLVALPRLPAADITSVTISPSEKRLAFYVNGDRSPSNLYLYTLGEAAPRRLTESLGKDIDPEDLVEAEVVRFPSFDGLAVPNILWKPLSATAERKAPALVWVHGGPGGQTRKGYSALIQYLVNHGYVVLGINNRGSSGYGKTFFTADDQKHGKEPLWDCVAARKYLASPALRGPGSRSGIIGGSYGGYMVLAALAFEPEVFDVGVDIFGVSNWLRTLESIPSWWEAQRVALYKEIGDPVAQKDMLMEISPVFHADKIKKPLLVLQGHQRPARHQARVRRHRRRREEERGARGVRRVPRRGPRLHEARQPDPGVRSHPRLPRPVPEGRGRGAAGLRSRCRRRRRGPARRRPVRRPCPGQGLARPGDAARGRGSPRPDRSLLCRRPGAARSGAAARGTWGQRERARPFLQGLGPGCRPRQRASRSGALSPGSRRPGRGRGAHGRGGARRRRAGPSRRGQRTCRAPRPPGGAPRRGSPGHEGREGCPRSAGALAGRQGDPAEAGSLPRRPRATQGLRGPLPRRCRH